MIVHTVIAVGERNLVKRSAITPLATGGTGVGRLGIFDRQVAELVTEIEAVGAYTTATDAQRAAAAHLAAQPKDRIKIKVVTVDALPAAARPPAPAVCVDCGTGIAGSRHDRCTACLKAFYQACRDADPLGGGPEVGWGKLEVTG